MVGAVSDAVSKPRISPTADLVSHGDVDQFRTGYWCGWWSVKYTTLSVAVLVSLQPFVDP